MAFSEAYTAVFVYIKPEEMRIKAESALPLQNRAGNRKDATFYTVGLKGIQ